MMAQFIQRDLLVDIHQIIGFPIFGYLFQTIFLVARQTGLAYHAWWSMVQTTRLTHPALIDYPVTVTAYHL
ncbi:hypothetical protein [Candidatus Nitrotoga sp. M5]|uniref:hypothetical protein n=1 Tax=Candidatus Nitrotoga sp. M5 TaxID=2890409 RepID=UPI001EF3AB6B|nr:hypothetical protein [Candidatus Nitrotoga sp. M5]